MKKILLGLFGIIVLGLINFSNAGSLTITGTVNITNPTLYAGTYFGYFSFPYPYKAMDIDCTFSNFNGTVPSTTNTRLSFFGASSSTYGTISSSTLCTFNSSAFNNGSFSCSSRGSNSNKGLYLGFNFGMTHNSSFSFNYSCVFSGEYLSLGSSDCSSVESQLSSCQSDLATATGNILSLSGSLSTCQSDLTTCQNSSSSSCDYSDYILLSDVTESYCTNRYSDLINESDITSGYCETEFGLIDPENCPASGGTGDVNWSSFFVNSHQIQGANNVYLWLPDFLNWDYTYIDSGSTLEINVENEGDPEYIENMLAIQTYRPTSDEFALSFFGGLYLLFPYIFIVLLVLFIWRLIKRIFK